uniref:Uncharacterized protein n=1 Tax=Panagrolaimus sp. JU765 TaxID=591449 RepID=A0AC34RNB7_9BILA
MNGRLFLIIVVSQLFFTTFAEQKKAEVEKASIFSCYNETNYWTGRHTGQAEECPEHQYCYILMGRSVTSDKSTRGCAPTYISDMCNKYKPANSKATQLFCFRKYNEEVQGKVCCCDSNSYCNSGTKIVFSILFIVSALFW